MAPLAWDYCSLITRASQLHTRLLTSLKVLWRLQTPGTHLRGVVPLTDGAAAGTWRRKRTRRVYSEGM